MGGMCGGVVACVDGREGGPCEVQVGIPCEVQVGMRGGGCRSVGRDSW